MQPLGEKSVGAMKRWKFLLEGMKSGLGVDIWKIGEWKKYDGHLGLSASGFHGGLPCARSIYGAFYCTRGGETLAEVEVRGEHLSEGDDKEVWNEMRVIRAWKWRVRDSVALAIHTIGIVLEIFEKEFPNDKSAREAIEAAEKWFETPTKENDIALLVAGNKAREAFRLLMTRANANYSLLAQIRRLSIHEKLEKWFHSRISGLEEIKGF